MKVSRRDILIFLAVVSGLWLAVILLPALSMRTDYKNAEEFCSTVKSGLTASEAIALAKENSYKRKLDIEPDGMRLSFGSGCFCRIRFSEGRAIPGVAICNY